MIANKMESNGIAGKINISEVTKKLIIKNFPQNFIFEDSNDVFIPSSNETIKGSFVYNYHEMF